MTMSGEVICPQSRLELVDVPHGTSVPLSVIERFVPQGNFILEVGSGEGDKASLLQQSGYIVTATDILPEAVKYCEGRGLYSMTKDATSFESADYAIASVSLLETQHGVLMEGVLPSLLDNQWQKMFTMVDMHMRPDGYLFLSDVQVVGEDENPLIDYTYRSYDEHQKYIQAWQRRYDENEKLGLPRHTFVVGKPGPLKHLEWGTVDDLKQLMVSNGYERLAQHVSSQSVIQTVNDLGFTIELFESKIWQTRVPGKELPGYVLVAKKGDTYKYHPWRYGYTCKNYGDLERWHEKRARRASPWYIQEMVWNLQQHIPYPLEEIYPTLLRLAQSEAEAMRIQGFSYE